MAFANNNYSISGYTGLYVLGEDNDEWAPSLPTWHQEDFWVGAVNEDGSFPSTHSTPWEVGYRAQTVPSGPANAAPDWSVEIIGACEDCAETSFELYVVADNLGSSFGPTGMEVRVYSVDGTTTTLLDSQTMDSRLEAGERTAPMTFTIDFADVGADGLLAIIDEDDVDPECDESNNENTWSATCE